MANRYGTEGNDVIDGSIFGDNIAGYGGDDVLRGLSGDDIIYAGGDDDWLDGGSGADTLYGLSGFDTASYEFAPSGVSIQLDGALCQNGVAQGDKLYSVEKVIGSAFNDYLYGLDGFAETMIGGADDDIVFGSTGADVLGGGGGQDLLAYVSSDGGVTVNLGASTASGGDAQGDTISGFERITGSAFADTLIGNSGANYIFGGLGDDTIRGVGGADTLGGSGGRDEMSGGGGRDTFLYSSAAESGTTAATRDVITDFTRSQGDRIDLSIPSLGGGTPGLPDPFAFRGQNAFTEERQVRFMHQDGDTIVQVNLEGSSGADLAIKLEGIVNLQASDFILV